MSQEGALVGVVDTLPEVEETACQIVDSGGRAWAAVFGHLGPQSGCSRGEEIQKELGDVDILVNNAGIVNNIAWLRKMKFESWQRELSVNLSAAFIMIQLVIGAMIEKKWGRIINVSAGAATGGLQKQVAYASSKAGLLGLTKTVTLEHARMDHCNAVLPD